MNNSLWLSIKILWKIPIWNQKNASVARKLEGILPPLQSAPDPGTWTAQTTLAVHRAVWRQCMIRLLVKVNSLFWMKLKFVQEMHLMPTLSFGAHLPSGSAVSWYAMASKALGTTAVCKLKMHTYSQVGTSCSPCKFSQLACQLWVGQPHLPASLCSLAPLWLVVSLLQP